MRTCFRCGTEKRASEFWKRAAADDGLCATCKDCMRQDESRRAPRHRNTYWEDPEAAKRRVRRYQARQKYKVPEANLDFVLECAESGECEICGALPPTSGFHKRHHIDHDHKTGKYRGILCKDCNFILGHAHDNPEVLRKAAEYLMNRTMAGATDGAGA